MENIDYKALYEEARERAKQVKLTDTKENVAAAEYIFPDLKESEDERMMWEFNDWLCEEIECRTNDLRDEKDRRTLNMLCYVLTKVKDWLEKQKESLHISESCKENADSFTSEDERIRKDLIYDIERLPMQGVLTHRSTSEYIAFLEKQEQKPLSPDEKMNHPLYLEGFDVGREVGKVEAEQAPAWSEEDEDMLEYIIGDVNDAKQLYTTQEAKDMADKEIAWLKSLRPQPKQEWSEEDEVNIGWLIAYLKGDNAGEYYDEMMRESLADWLENRFKSIRPSWKPSEEQIGTLERICSNLHLRASDDAPKLDEIIELLKLK